MSNFALVQRRTLKYIQGNRQLLDLNGSGHKDGQQDLAAMEKEFNSGKINYFYNKSDMVFRLYCMYRPNTFINLHKPFIKLC